MRILTALALAFALSPGLRAQSDPPRQPAQKPASGHSQAERPKAELSEKQKAKQEKLKAKQARQLEKNQKEIQRKRNEQLEQAAKSQSGVTRDIRKSVAKRRREDGHIYSDPGPRGLTPQERGLPPLPIVGEPEEIAKTEEQPTGTGLTAPGALDLANRGKRTPEQVAALRAVLEEDGKHRSRLAQLARLQELAAEQPFRKRELRVLQGREETRHQQRIEELRAEYGDATCRRASALAGVYAAKGRGRKP